MKSIEASYRLLDLPPGVDFSEVKKAFRKKALLCHPDLAGEEHAFHFQQINEAYAVLKNALTNRQSAKVRFSEDIAAKERAREFLIKKEIEDILSEALLDMSKLIRTVGRDENLGLSALLLRMQSKHPEVRFIAAGHLRKLQWEEGYAAELAGAVSAIPFDDCFVDLFLEFFSKAPLCVQKSLLPELAKNASADEERACIKILNWGKKVGWNDGALVSFLIHPSPRVLSIALSMISSLEELPLKTMLYLIKRKEEEVLLPILKKLRGSKHFPHMRSAVADLATNHPSLSVRAWANWVVDKGNVR